MRSKIECDVNDVLDQANVLLLSAELDEGQAKDLIDRIHRCAGEALVAGLESEARRLWKVAEHLEKRLG